MKIKYHSLLCVLATIALSSPFSALSVNAQKAVSKTWNPNVKNGMYRNPVIDADYSDPDVCRVGNDYYMTSSSFQCFPGLQILHSTDLVNWEIIGAALLDDYPVLPEDPQRLKAEYSDDWLHLNPKGYEAMGKFAAEKLK